MAAQLVHSEFIISKHLSFLDFHVQQLTPKFLVAVLNQNFFSNLLEFSWEERDCMFHIQDTSVKIFSFCF